MSCTPLCSWQIQLSTGGDTGSRYECYTNSKTSKIFLFFSWQAGYLACWRGERAARILAAVVKFARTSATDSSSTSSTCWYLILKLTNSQRCCCTNSKRERKSEEGTTYLSRASSALALPVRARRGGEIPYLVQEGWRARRQSFFSWTATVSVAKSRVYRNQRVCSKVYAAHMYPVHTAVSS